jgi:hypothetical protein
MFRLMFTAAFLASSLLTRPAQTVSKPLIDDDAAAMAQGGRDETTIIGAIRSESSSFDTSASSLLKLKRTGVTPQVMGAMFAAVARRQASSQPSEAAAPVQAAVTPVAPASEVPEAQPKKRGAWLRVCASHGVVAQALSSAATKFSTSANETGGSAKRAIISHATAMVSGLATGHQAVMDASLASPPSFQTEAANLQAQTLPQNLYWMSPTGEVISVPETPQTSAPPAATTASATAPKGAIIMFMPWRDPREGAFTVNVPQGWQVSGGTTRSSAIDARQSLRATSPDGLSHLLLGDPDLIPREVPNRLLGYAGVREGQTMKGPWGGPLLIARYQTGEQFARSYASRLCAAPQITSSNVVPDATRQLTAKAVEYGRAQGAPAQAWVGEVTFRCGTQTGYLRASTVMAGSPAGAQVWGVLELSGFMVADPSEVAFARYILNNIIGSIQMNPQWEARQAQTTRDVSGAVTRAQQQMAASIAQHAREQASHDQIDVMSGWEARNKSLDASRQRRDEAFRGTVTANDTYTGSSHTVNNDYIYYWTRSDGSIAGTMTDTPPDYSNGWRMMTTH